MPPRSVTLRSSQHGGPQLPLLGARLWPVQQTPLGTTIGDEELAADKSLALFGRAAARDYLDVRALARRHGEQGLIDLAQAKDLGFSSAHLGQALAAIDRLDREQFEVSDDAYRELRTWAARWSDALRPPGIEHQPRRSRGPETPDRDLGPDLGL